MADAFLKPARFSDAEWQARVQLAACYRIFAHLGWAELIYNHISLRVPGQKKPPLHGASHRSPSEGAGSSWERPGDEPDHFLINPFGLHYTEVTASNLVKVDADGNIIGNDDWPINPAGFTFHGAIHAALPNAHCVMHVHTTPTMAVCCLKDGLSFTNFYAAQLYGQVAYHAFEGITVHREEGARILASARRHAGPLHSDLDPLSGREQTSAPKGLDDIKPVLLLRNHGPVVIGSSLPQAFNRLWVLQRACEVQLASQPLGALQPISETALQACVRDSLNFKPLAGRAGEPIGPGEDSFAALQRLVDRIDPGYRA